MADGQIIDELLQRLLGGGGLLAAPDGHRFSVHVLQVGADARRAHLQPALPARVGRYLHLFAGQVLLKVAGRLSPRLYPHDYIPPIREMVESLSRARYCRTTLRHDW